jgi:hypothetical protein
MACPHIASTSNQQQIDKLMIPTSLTSNQQQIDDPN